MPAATGPGTAVINTHTQPWVGTTHTHSIKCIPLCGGQTSPHKPRLVASHSTCSPRSSSPHAHSFVVGTAIIKNNSNLLYFHLSVPPKFGIHRRDKRPRTVEGSSSKAKPASAASRTETIDGSSSKAKPASVLKCLGCSKRHQLVL